jgi:hypothetical protein
MGHQQVPDSMIQDGLWDAFHGTNDGAAALIGDVGGRRGAPGLHALGTDRGTVRQRSGTDGGDDGAGAGD